MQTIHDIINYPNFICSFESRKCGGERKNYKNLNISRTKRALTFFIVFEGLAFGEKIKNSGHKL